jgi:hypothetical protein
VDFRIEDDGLEADCAAPRPHLQSRSAELVGLLAAVASDRRRARGLADYFVALFNAADTVPLRAKLLGYGIEIENFARFGDPWRCGNGAAGDN